MNSIDYAKVLKHLLKIVGYKCFLLIPLKDKDYGIVWKMYINNGIKTRELVNNIGSSVFMHSSYNESLYYELYAHTLLENGIYWPCKENQLLACIDEQRFCRDMCDALFSAASSKGVKIGKYSPVQFIARNTEIEQIAIEAELANEK